MDYLGFFFGGYSGEEPPASFDSFEANEGLNFFGSMTFEPTPGTSLWSFLQKKAPNPLLGVLWDFRGFCRRVGGIFLGRALRSFCSLFCKRRSFRGRYPLESPYNIPGFIEFILFRDPRKTKRASKFLLSKSPKSLSECTWLIKDFSHLRVSLLKLDAIWHVQKWVP